MFLLLTFNNPRLSADYCVTCWYRCYNNFTYFIHSEIPPFWLDVSELIHINNINMKNKKDRMWGVKPHNNYHLFLVYVNLVTPFLITAKPSASMSGFPNVFMTSET